MKGAVTAVVQLDLNEPPECVADAGSWCQQVWHLTGNSWLAGSAEWLVAKPLAIVLTIVVALLVRWLIHRLIDRLTRLPSAAGDDQKRPALLRPLKEKAPNLLNSTLMERRRQRAKTIGSVLKSVASFLIFSIAVMQILSVLGVNLAPILASAGIAGVALGFGAQNLVKDFLSGLFMMAEDQYGVGDVVDLGDASGVVESVGLRITTLRDINGTVWYVRNGEILRVGNSSQGHANAVVDMLLAPGSDIDRASRIMQDVATEVTAEEPISADVLEPPNLLGVNSITAEGITLRLTVKVKAGRQYAVERALRARITTALTDAGFETPSYRLLVPRSDGKQK
ncbi:MAG: mechanosensitive ion channel family protein [Thermocrispum agreste]|uniref:Mechanosensitive ion channel family protein n=1 Tax=Thermocrispum agreste TaxID=37925 RepID=A0ABD6FFH5_9PSEU